MALRCLYDKKAYLYYSKNLSYTGVSLTYAVNPWFINFDSNGRLVVISSTQIIVKKYYS